MIADVEDLTSSSGQGNNGVRHDSFCIFPGTNKRAFYVQLIEPAENRYPLLREQLWLQPHQPHQGLPRCHAGKVWTLVLLNGYFGL